MNRGGRKRHALILLGSPRTGPVILSILPFILLFVGAGILLGGWTLPQTEYIESAKISADGAEKSFLRQHNGKPLPIAWLMSFPNSGTSFTSELVRRVARQNTASNYGTEDLGASVAVFEDSPEGPFWTDAHNNELARPTRGFILVKTHCGGYCDSCPPDKYIEDAQIFTRNCASGYHFTKDGNGEPQKVLDSYSKELVGRAVHLIRDPFDNIVSRFHLTYKQFVVSNQTEKIANYPRSKEGFRSFCRDMGETFYEEEKSTEVYRDVFDVMTNVPCHADFFRYIQWHNLAFTTTTDIRIPTMIIHYENYTDNFNQTKDMLLEFLGQSAISEPPPFETGKTYREYFTDEEVQAVSTMFSKLGMDETWDRTKHYFV